MTTRYANVYRKDGTAAYKAVPITDLTSLLWQAKFEEGLEAPDYDICQTRQAALDAARDRQGDRAKSKAA